MTIQSKDWQSTNWQSDFTCALLDAEKSAPSNLKTWNGSDPNRRFNVYRNNVFVNLVDGLATKFPVCQQLVGEEFFRAMAQIFVREQPPTSRLMAEYGDEYPDFIDVFPPAAEVPYLADVARLEACRVAAYHSADADVLGLEEWNGVGQDVFPELSVDLHPSLHLLSSRFSVYSIWDAHQVGGNLTGVDPSHAESVAVFRKEMSVEVALLPPGGTEFFAALGNGEILGVAAQKATEAAAEVDAEFDLAAMLGLLIQQQLATSVSKPSDKLNKLG